MCSDLIKNLKNKKIFFFLRLGFSFQNLEKSHLISIGNTKKFLNRMKINSRGLRYIVLLSYSSHVFYESLPQRDKNHRYAGRTHIPETAESPYSFLQRMSAKKIYTVKPVLSGHLK